MNDPKTCNHEKLRFGSGGYYIFCQECPTHWLRFKTGVAEDGAEHDGNNSVVGDRVLTEEK